MTLYNLDLIRLYPWDVADFDFRLQEGYDGVYDLPSSISRTNETNPT